MERRERLEWLRDELVATWEEAVPSERPSLAKQIRDTLAELAALPPVVKVGDPVDDFTARLAKRRRVASASGEPAKVRKPRAGGG